MSRALWCIPVRLILVLILIASPAHLSGESATQALPGGSSARGRSGESAIRAHPGGSFAWSRSGESATWEAPEALHQGLLRGRVVSLPDSQAVADALVTITSAEVDAEGRTAEATSFHLQIGTDALGRFQARLSAGTYDVAVQAFGMADGHVPSVEVGDDATVEITVFLETAPFRLDQIVVTPSTYGIFKDPLVGGQVLTREEVQVMPHIGDDIFRSVDRLPGVATYDATAKIHVRGSPSNEVLSVLDGLELYEPYHLKDWDGALSIIDVESVGDIDLTTGGFSAEYGDKSTGVFAMESTTPPSDRRRTTLGMSLMNLTFKSEGGFAQEKGGYLVSARRGFLDLLFAITGEDDEYHYFRAHEDDTEDTRAVSPGELHPTYYDVFGKVEYQVRPGHRLSAHFLHASDDMNGMEEDSTRYNHGYGSSYLWMNWDANLSPRVSARTVLSVGRVSHDRNGGDYDSETGALLPERILSVRDEATFDFVGLKQDWSYLASNRLLLKGGFDLKRGTADYDYFRWRKVWVPNTTDPLAPLFTLQWDTLTMTPSRTGTEIGAYAAGRVHPFERLTTEIGVRFDRQSHTSEQSVAPRVNAALQLTPTTILRGAWGHYHQSHALQELWTADGDTAFYPAQRAEQRVLGLEHRLKNGTTLRLEAYQRLIADPLPEYRNLTHFIEGLREEGPEDRRFIDPARGEARGLELMVKSGLGRRLAWSASYALSMAEEEVDGVWVPRPMDQRHALQLQAAYRPSSDWTLSADWVYHSGWPCTGETYTLAPMVRGANYISRTFGPMNGERLPAYHRLDVRASRRFQVRGGALSVYLDFFNVYNRKNPQSVDYYARWDSSQGRILVEEGFRDQLGMLPTFGLRWEF